MKTKEFNKVIENQITRCRDILIVKAKEYSADDDRLHNFKIAAPIMHTDEKGALAGMMAKHTVSVYDMATSEKKYPTDLWEEKITDSINYLLLLRAIVSEENAEETE